jgi:Na+-driven multidrug efflux pump
VDSIAIAAQTLLGQQAENKDVAALIVRRAIHLSLSMGTCLAVALLLLRNIAPRAFSADPIVLALAAQVMPIVAISQPLNALAFIWDGILYGVSGFKYVLHAANRSPFLAGRQVAYDRNG